MALAEDGEVMGAPMRTAAEYNAIVDELRALVRPAAGDDPSRCTLLVPVGWSHKMAVRLMDADPGPLSAHRMAVSDEVPRGIAVVESKDVRAPVLAARPPDDSEVVTARVIP